jgi:hypothetical protein
MPKNTEEDWLDLTGGKGAGPGQAEPDPSRTQQVDYFDWSRTSKEPAEKTYFPKPSKR